MCLCVWWWGGGACACVRVHVRVCGGGYIIIDSIQCRKGCRNGGIKQVMIGG